MTIHLDGSTVSYAGLARDNGPAPGDQGRVLIADEGSAHVMWSTGSISGQVTLVEQGDLDSAEPQVRTAGQTVREHLGQSLEYEAADPDSVLAGLDDDGSLDRLSMISEDVVEWVATRLRSIGSFQQRLATLDSSDSDAVVQEATRRVLADAMESLEDEG